MDSVEAATFVRPGSPPITQITFLACRAQYPGGPNRCLSVSSLFARPSPVNRRVGVHDFTFEACSSFTHITACKIAGPPRGGRLSRGFGPASYPTAPLGSYHVSPTTTWMDPPSISDLRLWGALLTEGSVSTEVQIDQSFPSFDLGAELDHCQVVTISVTTFGDFASGP
jgi:hypothetical protein